jgi:hypothetical protein
MADSSENKKGVGTEVGMMWRERLAMAKLIFGCVLATWLLLCTGCSVRYPSVGAPTSGPAPAPPSRSKPSGAFFRQKLWRGKGQSPADPYAVARRGSKPDARFGPAGAVAGDIR